MNRRLEWEHLEGHKTLHKDIIMETHPPLTSPDGPRNRNPPERCSSPLYSWDSTRERHKILRCYQYKKLKPITTEMKEDAKETFLMGDGPCKEEEIPIKIGTDPGGTRVTPIKAEEEVEGNAKIKEEKIPPEISTDGSRNRNTPERCPSPLYSRDSTRERHKVLRCYQYKKLKPITSETKEDAKETFLMGDGPCKEEEIPIKISTDPRGNRAAETNIKAENEERRVKAKRKILEIGMDGRYRWYNTEKHPDSEIVDDDITAYVAKEKARTANLQPVRYKEDKPYSCPECGKRFTHEKYLIIHYRCHSGERPFFCAECGKSFSFRSSLDKHKVTHTTVGAFPCPECGKRFRAGWILAAHGKVHSSENVHR